MGHFVPCGNPQIATIKSTGRNLAVSNYFHPVEKNGELYCGWCCKNKLEGRKQKYCSKACSESCYLWANPQSISGLAHLLNTKGKACAMCDHTWEPAIDKLIQLEIKRIRESDSKELFKRVKIKGLLNGNVPYEIASRLRGYCEDEFKPEIDHVTAVALGGETTGFDNLQLLCRTCHKEKTLADRVKILEFKKRK